MYARKRNLHALIRSAGMPQRQMLAQLAGLDPRYLDTLNLRLYSLFFLLGYR